MSSTDLLPYSIAKEKGFFDKYGVNVEIQKFYSANDRDAAFQTKSIDGTITDLTGAIIQKANGIDLKIISKEYGVFHVLAGRNAGISKLEEVKGKQVASSKNTVIDFVIDMALKSAGLQPEDIKRQEINKIPIRLEMLQNGQTDVTGLPEPFISIALKNGASSLIDIDELDYNITGMVFHTSVIEEKPEQIQLMYEAYNDAVEYIRNHDRNEYAEILTKYLGVPEELTETVLLPNYGKASQPNSGDIHAVTDWLKEKKLIPDTFVPNQLLTTQFVE